MERKFEIPEMSIEEIAKRYATISPIVHQGNTARYLRKLSTKELTQTTYIQLTKPKDYAKVVDYSKLSVLTDIKMLNLLAYYGFFKPDVDEILRQIPDEYLEKIVAFEIISGLEVMDKIYPVEFISDFHVFVVRLYQAKNDTNAVATPIKYWSTPTSTCSLGINQEDFKKIIKLIE